MTQQNAALVEESSSAAAAMRDQSAAMTDIVATFTLGEDEQSAPPAKAAPRPVASAPKSAVKPASRATPKMPAAALKPSATSDGEWEHF